MTTNNSEPKHGDLRLTRDGDRYRVERYLTDATDEGFEPGWYGYRTGSRELVHNRLSEDARALRILSTENFNEAVKLEAIVAQILDEAIADGFGRKSAPERSMVPRSDVAFDHPPTPTRWSSEYVSDSAKGVVVVKPRLFAITGPAGCGKTTVTKALIEALKVDDYDTAVRVRFAGPLKAMLRTLGLTEAQVDGDEKEIPLDLLCGHTSRFGMITLGTLWGRDTMGENIWVRAAMRQVDDTLALGLSVVIDDCRFDNEAEVLTRRGAVIVELQRDGAMYSDAHASEAGISPHYLTACLDNNGDVDDVIDSILSLTPKAQS